MLRHSLFDEIHISLTVPRALDRRGSQAIRRTLRSRKFQESLESAIRAAIGRFPALRVMRLEVSR